MPVNLATVKEAYGPLESGDMKGFMSRVKDDVKWTVGNPNLKSFPVAGVYDVSTACVPHFMDLALILKMDCRRKTPSFSSTSGGMF